MGLFGFGSKSKEDYKSEIENLQRKIERLKADLESHKVTIANVKSTAMHNRRPLSQGDNRNIEGWEKQMDYIRRQIQSCMDEISSIKEKMKRV